MFEFLMSKARLVEFAGRQLVFLSKSRYTLRRTHPVKIQLQPNKPARVFDVRVESSRPVDGGFVYVGKIRGSEPAPLPLRGESLRAATRRHCALSFQGSEGSGRTLDFSRLGFRAQVEGKLQPGQRLDLSFQLGRPELDGITVPVVVEVRWVRHESGIGGLAGFRILSEIKDNERAVSILEAVANKTSSEQILATLASFKASQETTEEVESEPLCQESEPRELSRHGVKAILRGFSWDGPQGSLLLRFTDQKGRVRRLLFPSCQRLRFQDVRPNIKVAELVAHELCPDQDGYSTAADLTSAVFRLYDHRGALVLEIVSQQFRVLRKELETRNVVAFRRRAHLKVAGF